MKKAFHTFGVLLTGLLGTVTLFLSTSVADAACAAPAGSLQNPLTFCDIPTFIATALKVLVIVALPIITLFIVVAGFMFVFARGKPEGLKKARENFVYVIIGSILILGAWVIATLIGGTISQLVA